MAHVSDEVLVHVLRLAAERDPQPFYPSDRPASLPREVLDPALDRLRLAGLLELTEWTRDKGQGIRLTDIGRRALADPRLLHRPKPAPVAPQTRDDSTWERGEALRQAFMNPQQGIVVRLLLGINVAAFAVALALSISQGVSASAFLFEGETLRANAQLGALNTRQAIILNQWWRLITYGFLHGGLLHIAFNMSALWSLGRLMENIWGRVRFGILYFFSLAAGGCMVLAVGEVRFTVGASGALFGLLPSLALVAWLNRDQLPDAWKQSLRQTLMMNLIIGVMISTMPGVSWAGHLGGALGGLVISLPLHFTRDARPAIRRLAWLSIPLLFVAMVLAVYGEYYWY